MSEDKDAASKTEEPTPRKLEQAKKRGEVVKTPDLSTLASLAAAASVCALAGGWLSRNLANALQPFLARPETMSFEGGGMDIAHLAVMAGAPILLTVVLAAAAGGAAGNLAQTGLMFTPEKLAFDPQKLSPIAGFKRIFGLARLVGVGKPPVDDETS